MKVTLDQVRREKAELEKVLRRETQLNEENYLKIQILKDKLEKKMSDTTLQDQTQSQINSGEIKQFGGKVMTTSMREAFGST